MPVVLLLPHDRLQLFQQANQKCTKLPEMAQLLTAGVLLANPTVYDAGQAENARQHTSKEHILNNNGVTSNFLASLKTQNTISYI